MLKSARPRRSTVVAMRWLPLLLLVPLASLPLPASAQQQVCGAVMLTCQTTVELQMVPPKEPIPPDGPFVALPVTVKYTYLATAPLTFSPTRVDLSVTDAPHWAVATLTPSTLYMPVSQLRMSQDLRTEAAQAFLLVSTTADAPAFTPGSIEVLARAHDNGGLKGSSAKNAIPVQADFFILTEARTPVSRVRLSPGEEQQLPMTLTNHGNADVQVTFTLEGAPANVRVGVPQPVVLEARQQGSAQTRSTIMWTFKATRDFEPGEAVLLVQSAYALDPKVRGPPQRVVIEVDRGEGGGLSVQSVLGIDGPAGVLGMGVLGAAVGLGGYYEWQRRKKA